ncbi:MAG: hypothetical protein ACKVS9_04375 [Phycisphaerae bacterium]
MPEFSSGGLQLQVWNGENEFASRNAADGDLSHDAETVSWTSSISTNGAVVEFGIDNGFSSSWGSFGGDSMRVRTGRPVHSFPYYSTGVSAANSWVTYGTNRVVTLEITEVHFFDANGELVRRDTMPRVIASMPGEEGIASEEDDD